MYFQDWRGYPLAARRWDFPGSTGYQTHYHGAIDYPAPLGTPIRAPQRAKVIQFGRDRVSGALYVYLAIRPGTRWEVWHVSRFRSGLYLGQILGRGAVVAYVGSTGWSTGPHAHCVLKITERDPDGVTRTYLYNPLLFHSGAPLQWDRRILPAY